MLPTFNWQRIGCNGLIFMTYISIRKYGIKERKNHMTTFEFFGDFSNHASNYVKVHTTL